jgi:hypothetical protein
MHPAIQIGSYPLIGFMPTLRVSLLNRRCEPQTYSGMLHVEGQFMRKKLLCFATSSLTAPAYANPPLSRHQSRTVSLKPAVKTIGRS